MHTFEPATPEELKEIIFSMEIKTCFDDPIPSDVYKPCVDTLLPYLLDMVITSLASGDISGLEESTIIPILNNAGLDKNIYSNYRPITNL